MNVDAYKNYAHYDAQGAPKYHVLTPSDIGTRAAKFAEYAEYVNNEHEIASGEELQPSPEQLATIESARKFVEVLTGIRITCNVRLFTDLGKPCLALYDSHTDEIAVLDTLPSMYAHNQYSFGRLLVHEMMHATAGGNIAMLDIETREGRQLHHLPPHQVETDITLGVSGEHFFEEALAEQAAGRWQEYINPAISYQDRNLKPNDLGIPLPVRTYVTLESNQSYVRAAYATFGVQLLSEYLGVNLFRLLLDARQPETRERASHEIKGLVDSVEPGLYDVLMSAEYTQKDFTDCLEIIKQAIATHAHDRHLSAA